MAETKTHMENCLKNNSPHNRIVYFALYKLLAVTCVKLVVLLAP